MAAENDVVVTLGYKVIQGPAIDRSRDLALLLALSHSSLAAAKHEVRVEEGEVRIYLGYATHSANAPAVKAAVTEAVQSVVDGISPGSVVGLIAPEGAAGS